MFTKLLQTLMATPDDTAPDIDVRLAICTLLVRVARIDGHYCDSEAKRIDAILTDIYDMDQDAAQTLRAQAEHTEEQASDSVRFTKIIKDHVAYEDRADIVQTLWSVALADGYKDDDEHGFMRLVANLLGVSDRANALARQQAAQKQIDAP